MGKLRQRHGTARVLTVCGSLYCRACPLPQAISGEGWPVASATGRHLAARIGQGPTVSEVRPRAAWLSAGSAAGSRSPGPAQLSLPPLLPLWALRRGIWGCVTQQDRSSKAAVWWGLESECCGWALAVHPPPPAQGRALGSECYRSPQRHCSPALGPALCTAGTVDPRSYFPGQRSPGEGTGSSCRRACLGQGLSTHPQSPAAWCAL